MPSPARGSQHMAEEGEGGGVESAGAVIADALPGYEPDFEEWRAVQDWKRREIDPLTETDDRAILVLGSYRGDQHITLRAVQHELGVRQGETRAVVVGDTRPLAIGRDGYVAGQAPGEEEPLTFRVKLFALADAAETIVCVLEDEAGGEALELERIASPAFFDRTHVFPRGYPTIEPESWRTLSDVYRVAEAIYTAEELDDAKTEQELRRVVSNARAQGFETNEADLCRYLQSAVPERDGDGPGSVERDSQGEEGEQADSSGVERYNWPQLSTFRQFELAGRCHTWQERTQLRELVADVI
jgi:hypothetical protein